MLFERKFYLFEDFDYKVWVTENLLEKTKNRVVPKVKINLMNNT